MWFKVTVPEFTVTALTPLISYDGKPSIYMINLFACFGSNAVKNISLEFSIAICLFILFCYKYSTFKNYAGKVAPVGKMLKSK